MNSTLSKIVGILLLILLVVVVVKAIDRNDRPNNEVGNAIENVGDNIQEAADDTSRKIEDAVD